MAGGGDEPLSSSGDSHLVPQGAEVSSGVPFGASKMLSDDPGRVTAGEEVEDGPIPAGQHGGGFRFESGRQDHSQVMGDGEPADGDRCEDRPGLFDGDVGGDDPGGTASHRGTHDDLVDDGGDDDLRNPDGGSGGGFGTRGESDVGSCVVAVGDETGRDGAQRGDEPLVGGHVIGERDRPQRRMSWFRPVRHLGPCLSGALIS